MSGKLVTEGYEDMQIWYFENDQTSRPADSLYIGLYTNTTEPAISATLSSGVTELALSGYGRIQLLDADWTTVADLCTNVEKTFTAGVEWGNVYGWFITNLAVGVGSLIAVKHFTNGPFFVLNGKPVKVTPKMLIGPAA